VTPQLFRQAILRALTITALGIGSYMLMGLASNGEIQFSEGLWFELIPILLIAGFLSRLFEENRKQP
jgi:hypothetical protein